MRWKNPLRRVTSLMSLNLIRDRRNRNRHHRLVSQLKPGATE